MVILLDQFHLPENIYMIIFSTEQQAQVARMLVDEIKEKGGELGKTEMSMFATMLHDGTKINITTRDMFNRVTVKQESISYNKRQFYDRILTPMKGMGLIDYDLYKKTYKVSDRFNNEMIHIGILWKR